MTPHCLSHTYALLHIQQGESLAYHKEQLGHSSSAVTVDTYWNLVPGGNRAAVGRLDDLPLMHEWQNALSITAQNL